MWKGRDTLLVMAAQARRIAETSYGIVQAQLLSVAEEAEREAAGLHPIAGLSGARALIKI